MKVAVLLHNIRSAHNVGSLFRSADGAGVACVYLSGYTPLPIDSFGNAQKDIQKTALGAEKNVPWKRVSNLSAFITQQKKERVIVGLEQDTRAIIYTRYKPSRDMLLILGNEVKGISPQLRNQCDVLVEIPMKGTKESLNVSVAGALAFFQFSR